MYHFLILNQIDGWKITQNDSSHRTQFIRYFFGNEGFDPDSKPIAD